MPLTASQVDATRPFSPDELLYRRVDPDELVNGELSPTSIKKFSFSKVVADSPSVNRSDFSSPLDVLHVLCADKDVEGWSIFFIRVDGLPQAITSGDNRTFCFFPKHLPNPTCGAHSVIACCYSTDAAKNYVRPSPAVMNDFKVKMAIGLKCIYKIFDIQSREPISNTTAEP